MSRKNARRDEWDARLMPEGKPPRGGAGGRNQGLTLMLLAIGIPLVLFFIQVDGVLRFSTEDKIFERTLTAGGAAGDPRRRRQAPSQARHGPEGRRADQGEVPQRDGREL